MLSSFRNDTHKERQNKKQPFPAFRNEKTNSITEYTCRLLLVLFIFMCVPTQWQKSAFQLDAAWCIFLHIITVNWSLADYEVTECTDVAQLALILCTTYCSHVSTTELNMCRDLGIVSMYFSWGYRPCGAFSTLAKVISRCPENRN